MVLATQLMPVLVQTSIIGTTPPRASTSACDSVGASVPNTVVSTSSHNARRRCKEAVKS